MQSPPLARSLMPMITPRWTEMTRPGAPIGFRALLFEGLSVFRIVTISRLNAL